MYTVGHGTLPQQDFVALVHGAGIVEVVDIRSYPGSRRNPQYGRETMATWLPQADIGYVWRRDLGGRRKAVPDSRHISLRHEAFRGYADYMETEAFRAGVDALLERGEGRAVMCSESVWWRCHRRLLADHLQLLRGAEVLHLMHDGRLIPHPPTQGVRVDGDGLAYDLPERPSRDSSGPAAGTAFA